MVKPENVVRATNDYLREEDAVQQWIDECCEEVPDYPERVSDLYKSFASWARSNGLWERNQNVFGRALNDKGYAVVRTTKGISRIGLKLKDAFAE